ncbi:MAG: SPOR domain-containing protein [Gemmatimonadales bacterium]
MNFHLSTLGVGTLLLAAACGREQELKLGNLPASTRGPAPSSAVRLPRDGGQARLYRVPSLEPSSWSTEEKLPPLERAIGADPEQGLVYAIDTKHNVVGVDLETRRVRSFLEEVRYAAVGPDGALYTVDTGSVVTQLVRRTPVRFRSKLQGTPAELHGTMGGSLIARLAGNKAALEVLGSDQAPTSVPLPPGPMATSRYGDLVAVAADTAVVIYDPAAKRAPLVVHVSGHARDVVFSPSGHRIYVARDDRNLLVLDRFTGDALGEIELPGPSKELRRDEYGQWLLVRPAEGDSVWVVDVGKARYAGAVATGWASDLPAVAAPSALLIRIGEDVRALNLAAEGFPEVGRVKDAAADLWLPLRWRPARDAEALAVADSGAEGDDSAGAAAPSVFLQVSSSQNPTWARELGEKLKGAGLPASVLPPARSDEAYRVVLGPYGTREQAEEAGKKIGMPSFVVAPQDPPER